MDIWETAVQIYLTTSRGVFVNPQYLLGELNGWRAEPDFLALDFYKRTAWMVEVSIAPQKIWEKASQFERDYKPRLRDQLTRTKVLIQARSDWTIGFWAFVFQDQVDRTVKAMRSGRVEYCEVTALERTLKDFWDERFDKQELGRSIHYEDVRSNRPI